MPPAAMNAKTFLSHFYALHIKQIKERDEHRRRRWDGGGKFTSEGKEKETSF